MFGAVSWHKPSFPIDTALRHLVRAAKSPILLGSFAAVALVGALTRIAPKWKWLDRRWSTRRSQATVIPARTRAGARKIMPAPHQGKRKKRNAKRAAH
jgi:hypothetical protein